MREAPPTYHLWMNVVLYEAVWFVAVLGRERLALLAFALVAAHLALCRDRPREIVLILLVTAIGVATDAALTLGGVFAFDPRPSPLPVPLWLVAIWLAFAGTLRHALAPVLRRAPLAIALGVVGGPLSYLGAERLGAVSLPQGAAFTALVLAPVWAALMTLFIAIARRAPSPAAARVG